MKRKMAMALLTAALCAGNGMTAFAMPELMPDGGVFDVEYYAEENPDVVAVMGSGKDALYLHYTLAGKAEGRLPGVAFDAEYYAANNPDVAAVFGTEEDVLYQHYRLCGKGEGRLPSAPGTELKPLKSSISAEQIPIEGMQGAFGEWYYVPAWGSYEELGEVNGTDKMISMGVTTEVQYDIEKIRSEGYGFEQIESYAIPGYKWYMINTIAVGEEGKGGRWWGQFSWRWEAQNSDNWTTFDAPQFYTDSSARQFTVTQDGVAYPECKVFNSQGQLGEVSWFCHSFVLLPENYTGNFLFKIYPQSMDEAELVDDKQNAITYVIKQGATNPL